MTLRFLFPMKKHGTFFMFVCSAILVKSFAVPTSLFMSVSPPCPIYELCPLYTQCSKRRFPPLNAIPTIPLLLNDVLRTIMMHNTLSFPRQLADFFRVAHRLN